MPSINWPEAQEGAFMFITTPLIRWVVNRLFQSGKIDGQQRDQLLSQDRQINVVITGAALVLFASLFI
ncbi:MAG: hypothetical protein CMM07_17195 [Rhodopirellula sp.]|nr:hypothetical protein [Rhodopirellula sp.]